MAKRRPSLKKLRRAARRAGVTEHVVKLIEECLRQARSLRSRSIYTPTPRFSELVDLGWIPARSLSEALPATAVRTDIAWALRTLIRTGVVEERRVEGISWIRLASPLQALANQAV